MKSIDLGRESNSGCCCPEVAKPSDKKEIYYPSMYITSDKDLKIPESGEMTIRFRRNNESLTNRRDGETSYDVSFDVEKILDIKADDSKSEDSSAVLDRLRDEAESE